MVKLYYKSLRRIIEKFLADYSESDNIIYYTLDAN